MRKTRKTRFLPTNKRVLISFEVLSKIVMISVVATMAYGLLDFAMKVTGYRYLTAENLGQFLSRPYLFLPAILILIFVIYLAFVDISAILYIRNHSHFRKKTDLLYALRFGFRNTRRLLRKENRAVIGPVLVTFIYFLLAQIPFLLGSYSIPKRLIRFFKAQWYLTALLIIVIVVLGILNLKNLYVFHFFTLENVSYQEAKNRSKELMKDNQTKDLRVLIRAFIFSFLFYCLLLAIGILVILLASKTLYFSIRLQKTSIRFIRLLLRLMVITTYLLGIPVGYLVIDYLFYKRKKQQDRRIREPEEIGRFHHMKSYERKSWDNTPGWKRFFTSALSVEGLVLVIAVCIFYWFSMQTYHGEFNPNIAALHRTEVTAHRGASRFYPENTMPAFEGAVTYGADWIELDVQQSKDGKIFVMHDTNFLRTTGVDAMAWDLTFREIRTLDAGSFKGPMFTGTTIPSLEEVIRFAQENHVKLNIEIKPSPDEPYLERDLVLLIKKFDFENRCVITSQAYSSIEKVKEVDPDIKTVYVMSFAYGDITKLKAADAFSIRYTSITERLVDDVHANGKEVYAWTVNSRDYVDLMLDRGVDNVITDDVSMAQARIQSNITSNPVEYYVNLLGKLLRVRNVRKLLK